MKKYLLLAAFTLLLAAASPAHADCDGKAKPDAAHDRSWVKNDTVIVYKQDKKIYRMALNSNKADLVADPQFDYIDGDLHLSADGRYALYEGWQTSKRYAAYLYDLTLGTEFKLPVSLPDAGDQHSLPNFAFSPDSTKLAWTEDAPFKGAVDFVVFTLGTHAQTTVAFPPEAKDLHDYRMANVQWSADGNDVYLGLIAYPKGAYYRYDVGATKLVKIDGAYYGYNGGAPEKSGMHFTENGKDVAYYGQACMQWQCPGQGKPADGESVAVDKDFQLVITKPDGKSVVVGKGSESFCSGVSIRPLSWLAEGKYLVYSLEGITYVYGVDEDRKAVLFDIPTPEFGWGDTEKRTSLPF